jgi:hypothetical protein
MAAGRPVESRKEHSRLATCPQANRAVSCSGADQRSRLAGVVHDVHILMLCVELVSRRTHLRADRIHAEERVTGIAISLELLRLNS